MVSPFPKIVNKISPPYALRASYLLTVYHPLPYLPSSSKLLMNLLSSKYRTYSLLSIGLLSSVVPIDSTSICALRRICSV